MNDDDTLLEPAAAGRLLELSPARVRDLCDDGTLASVRTFGRTRLVRRGDVLRLAEQRRQDRNRRATS